MESLLSNYASSDDEEEELQQPKPSPSVSTSSFFASLPKPKPNSSSSLFSSLPKPNSNSNSSSSLFSSLPKPRSSEKSPVPVPTSNFFSSLPPPKSENPHSKPKRVVQIRPPVNPFAPKSAQIDEDDDDDEEEEKARKKRNESESLAKASSVKSSLSSILPAPRNSVSLGALPSSGSGRRAIVEADVPASRPDTLENQQSLVVDQSVENYTGYEQGVDQYAGDYANYGTYESADQSSYGVDSSSYGNNESYGSVGEYGHYKSNWIDRSESTAPELSAVSERAFRIPGKRGRNDVPTEIVEIKQDELMKNRPREDQAKLTGIAFGPSYQPVSSSKGKPSKLHKRKHQIGTLYFDMKQKETELAERRAKGFLTKAETQAKYGW